MADIKISALPVSAGLDGTEIVPIVDGGVTQRTTTADIAALSTSAVSYLSMEGPTAPIVLPQDFPTDLTGWSVDDSAGTDITLDGDTQTIHFLTTGTYDIRAIALLVNGVGTTEAAFYATFSGGSVPAGRNGSSFGSLNLLGGGNAMAGAGLYRIAAGVTVAFGVSPHGGSGDDGLSFMGLDIFRIA